MLVVMMRSLVARDGLCRIIKWVNSNVVIVFATAAAAAAVAFLRLIRRITALLQFFVSYADALREVADAVNARISFVEERARQAVGFRRKRTRVIQATIVGARIVIVTVIRVVVFHTEAAVALERARRCVVGPENGETKRVGRTRNLLWQMLRVRLLRRRRRG